MNKSTTPVIIFITTFVVLLVFGVFVTYRTQVKQGDDDVEIQESLPVGLGESGSDVGAVGIPLSPSEQTGIPISLNTPQVGVEQPTKAPAAKVQAPASETSGWPKYQSEHGFSFQIPPGHRVQDSPGPNNETEGATQTRIVYVYLVDQEGKPLGTPKMVVNVIPSRGQVGFGLWEGARWEHYHTVMHSFNFDSGTLEVLEQF